jgi:demethylmenaquinone methyltransferase/2-methoxy-6-polyprenyl-1,4-benzoquinol methylase
MFDRDGSAPRVRAMFNDIAGRYDWLNHLLSANRDRAWRRSAVREIPDLDGAHVLDLCGGTGDLSLELTRAGRPALVVCCDFAHSMLQRARDKFGRERPVSPCAVLEGDGLRLPFPEGCFDAVTVAFGVRNFESLERGLREILRVLRPGGRLVVLEFSTPTGRLWGWLYRVYLRHVLPRLGDGLSRRAGPYGYLARTISRFPEQAALAGRIRDAGFAACGWRNLSGGIVAVHTAFKSLAPVRSRNRGAAPARAGQPCTPPGPGDRSPDPAR